MQLIELNTLKIIFEEVKHLLFTGSFNNAEQFIEAYETLQPDVTIMDPDLPGVPGIDAITKVKVNYPAANFSILSNDDDNEKIFKSLQAGAVGYLLKKVCFIDLPGSIESIFRGALPLSPEIVGKVIVYFRRHNADYCGIFQKLTRGNI